jgi:hypothetical protein
VTLISKPSPTSFSGLMGVVYPFQVPASSNHPIARHPRRSSPGPLTRVQILEVAYPYVARRLLTGETPTLFRARLLEAVMFKDGKLQWNALENMINIARSDSKFDLLPTAQMGLQFLDV